MKPTLPLAIILCATAVSSPLGQQPAGRLYKLEEMRWPTIDALDRERTIFILPIGMLEEHGPHLPIGSDTFGVSFEAEGAARRVARALPRWTVVMMPPVHYGQGGANILGGQLVHPGTYAIRQSTLRSIVADVGAHVARNRFKWIFVLNGHGAPPHNIAINEACDFVSETFKVTMLHVTGLFRADRAIQEKGQAITARHFPQAVSSSFGLDIHAGVSETSANLALRPALVDRGYRKLPALVGQTREELQAIASAPGWPGYLSSPAQATAAYGRDVEAWWVDGLSDLMLRAIGGQDLTHAPRAPDRIEPAVASVLGKALDAERTFERSLEEWLARRQ